MRSEHQEDVEEKPEMDAVRRGLLSGKVAQCWCTPRFSGRLGYIGARETTEGAPMTAETKRISLLYDLQRCSLYPPRSTLPVKRHPQMRPPASGTRMSSLRE